MRRALTILVVVVMLVVGSVAVDIIGYRKWTKRFERTAWSVANSPSAWDGKPRSSSADPAAYALVFGDEPTRFVKYNAKPITEPPSN
jgi:hypothetical protein